MENQQSPMRHFFLVHGTIVFTIQEEGKQQQINMLPITAVVSAETDQLKVRNLGLAQQQLQAVFHQKGMHECPGFQQVVDVVLVSTSHLAHCTHEDFYAPPEGFAAQERVTTPTNQEEGKPALSLVRSNEDGQPVAQE